MLIFEKRQGSFMDVNRYTSHAAATKSYNNLLWCSFVLVQFIPFKFVCLCCLLVSFFLSSSSGSELALLIMS